MPDMQQDPDGVWRQAIPLPFYKTTFPLFRSRFVCGDCAETFKTEQAYRDHYRSDHTLRRALGGGS